MKKILLSSFALVIALASLAQEQKPKASKKAKPKVEMSKFTPPKIVKDEAVKSENFPPPPPPKELKKSTTKKIAPPPPPPPPPKKG
ncbi:MAG: hypothetical protein ACOVMM_00445 [Chitinophagaceae bacterium]